jgi:hypothetical protein
MLNFKFQILFALGKIILFTSPLLKDTLWGSFFVLIVSEPYCFRLNWDGSKFVKIFLTRPFKSSIRKMDLTCSGKCILFFCIHILNLNVDLICSSSDGRLCLIKSDTGKVKIRIDDLFSSKATIGAFVNLDENDKIFAIGNDDGDVKVNNILLLSVLICTCI